MGQLAGKRILTFGDSIIAGHLYEQAGFVEFAAAQEGMKVVKFARNGACILPGRPVDEEGIGGMILTDQIARAAEEEYDPDYVVFNGGTNDAYEPVISRLGNAESQSRDTDTFAGAFRATIDAIRKNWPDAKVVYIAVHRLGYRDRTVQQALHETELSICADMGVRVVNLYDECGLDTSDEVMCRTYSFDRLVNGLPAPGDQPTGTHPNLKAIREFYVPFLVDTLNRAELFCFGKTVWDVRDDGMMLFWELPEGAEETDRYRIFVDGQQIGETGLTHYRISGLCPDTRYEIRLVAVRGGQVLQTVRTFCRTTICRGSQADLRE